MNDFQLQTPSLQLPRASRPSLGNYSLQLDPQLQADIRALLDNPPGPRLRGAFTDPNWFLFQQSQLDRILQQPPSTPTPAFTPGAGPAQARAADVSDLMRALMRVPAVRQGMNNVLDRAVGPLRQAAGNMTGAQTAILVTHAILMGGSLVTAINLQNSPPPFPLSLILNRDFPVPGVDGLNVQIRHRGGGVNWSNIGGSGVSVRGGASGTGGQFQGDFFITLDVQQWVPLLR